MICPYCREAIDEGAAVACRSCATAVHGDCATLHGRCVTFGCAATEFDGVTDPSARARGRLSPVLPLSVALRRLGREASLVAAAPLDALVVGVAGAAGVASCILGCLL